MPLRTIPSGMDFAAWEKDRKTIDAVIRNCEIIGEANSVPTGHGSPVCEFERCHHGKNH